MVQADFAEGVDVRLLEARNALRETPGFGDFLGTRGEPTALTESQVTSILSRMSDSEERPQVAINLRKGDMVKIKSGAFDGFDGTVDEVNPDKGTVKVTVTIFGRPTPVELEYWEVKPSELGVAHGQRSRREGEGSVPPDRRRQRRRRAGARLARRTSGSSSRSSTTGLATRWA